MSTYDVIVVGGRVAGASTALLLARAGLSVALVERGRRGSDTLSTHALMRAGVLQLSRWGVLDGIVAAGTPAVRRTVFHHADGEDVDVTIRPRSGVDALYAPRRHLLDRLLVEAAEEAGARVLHGATVTSLRLDATGRVTGVVGRTEGGARLDLAAGLTIGADGIRSRVAEQVGAATTWRGRTASAVLYRYVEDPGADAYEWTYGTGAARGRHPHQRRGLLPVRLDHARPHAPAAPSGASIGRSSTCWRRPDPPRWSGRATSGPSRRCAAGPGFPASPAGPPDPGGRWWGTPATSRTRSRRTASPTRCATPSCSRRRCWPRTVATCPRTAALARYEATRDRLSRQLFETTERVAAYDWDARHPLAAPAAQLRDGRGGRAPRAARRDGHPARA